MGKKSRTKERERKQTEEQTEEQNTHTCMNISFISFLNQRH